MSSSKLTVSNDWSEDNPFGSSYFDPFPNDCSVDLLEKLELEFWFCTINTDHFLSFSLFSSSVTFCSPAFFNAIFAALVTLVFAFSCPALTGRFQRKASWKGDRLVHGSAQSGDSSAVLAFLQFYRKSVLDLKTRTY